MSLYCNPTETRNESYLRNISMFLVAYIFDDICYLLLDIKQFLLSVHHVATLLSKGKGCDAFLLTEGSNSDYSSIALSGAAK
jgi:hypothetical protein